MSENQGESLGANNTEPTEPQNVQAFDANSTSEEQSIPNPSVEAGSAIEADTKEAARNYMRLSL